MKRNLTTALLISTYNWPQALRMVFESILVQSRMPDEILVADDGSENDTKELIDLYRPKFNVPVKHFWHPNNGFQKTVILNRAVAGTSCDYIVQIDGDIFMNRHFIKDHIKAAEPGYFIRGSRVMLSDERSKNIMRNAGFVSITAFDRGISNRINAIRFPLIAKLFFQYRKRSDNMHGCNCSFWREDFVKVNGYDNTLNGWGHEDIELAARFINAGLTQKKIKMCAVCYHMYHPVAPRTSVEKNFRIYKEVVANGVKTCLNGYLQHYA